MEYIGHTLHQEGQLTLVMEGRGVECEVCTGGPRLQYITQLVEDIKAELMNEKKRTRAIRMKGCCKQICGLTTEEEARKEIIL